MTISKLSKLSTLFFLTVLCFVSVQTVHAAVPAVMSYQGILKDSSGNYLTGSYSIVFKIYGASSGGSALWTETQSSISVSTEKYSVQLGSVTALNLDFSADYWLATTVGADSEMTPRTKLTTTPYAFTAQNVINGFTQAQDTSDSLLN